MPDAQTDCFTNPCVNACHPDCFGIMDWHVHAATAPAIGRDRGKHGQERQVRTISPAAFGILDSDRGFCLQMPEKKPRPETAGAFVKKEISNIGWTS